MMDHTLAISAGVSGSKGCVMDIMIRIAVLGYELIVNKHGHRQFSIQSSVCLQVEHEREIKRTWAQPTLIPAQNFKPGLDSQSTS